MLMHIRIILYKKIAHFYLVCIKQIEMKGLMKAICGVNFFASANMKVKVSKYNWY